MREQLLPPVVSALLPSQYGTHFLVAFALFRHHIHCLIKTHCFDQVSVPPSGSRKCLRFGLWPTLFTLRDFVYLLIY